MCNIMIWVMVWIVGFISKIIFFFISCVMFFIYLLVKFLLVDGFGSVGVSVMEKLLFFRFFVRFFSYEVFFFVNCKWGKMDRERILL